VEIRHEGGYTTCYSSLGEELAVSAGDTVTAGQTIGYAGSTALVETAMGSHVHFSVTSQGDPMDPAEFLALGE
jgi:murein DD-endopeptidase MepM/ murein hydrolase activator NlpD